MPEAISSPEERFLLSNGDIGAYCCELIFESCVLICNYWDLFENLDFNYIKSLNSFLVNLDELSFGIFIDLEATNGSSNIKLCKPNFSSISIFCARSA